MIRLAAPLALFAAGLYHSAGSAPDALSLGLIVGAGLLGGLGVLSRRRA
ncbi:hypothetical protein [Deinococcus humi]|uniref:Uncharacterized protein n=1 Tax=Deinococcus humi TaxID=662880 RepID=A0A7W8NBR2_9DEIO|nr:hypothetical protein [Deinococcus humi]MBB5361379.1 hypothetical protein [Deinococcus humi]GGO19786.1 hypothetical protein GCM10008949_04420 [Deinococcus humi]